MAADAPLVTCSDCGQHLDEDPGTPTEARIPCPGCGSMTRTIHVTIRGTITVRGKLGMKGRNSGGGKPFIEQVQGADLHRDTGQWRELTRIIDRDNDLYHEVVKDPDTGEVLHECREPLSEHRGHGAAKRRRTEPEDGEQGREGGRG